MNNDKYRHIISCSNKCPFEGFCFPGSCYYAKAGMNVKYEKETRKSTGIRVTI